MIRPSFRHVLTCAAVLAIPAVRAADVWNATGGNWSVGANWSTLAIPQPTDDVSFLDVGAGSTSTMDQPFTINSLTFGQDNLQTHTIAIADGLNLQVRDSGTGNILYVGSTTAATTASTFTQVAITGASTLTLNGSGDFVVRQGNSAAGSHIAVLDLSGLDTLVATCGHLLIGQATAGNAVNRPTGALYLAKTNLILLNGSAPQLMVQDAGQNANGGTLSFLTLGQHTELYADSLRLGGQKGNGTVNFNTIFTSPTFFLRNTDGSSRVSMVTCGDNSFASSGNNTVGIVDLSAGSSDLLIDTAYIARGNPGPSLGTSAGTFTIGAGVMDVNTLEIGYQVATGASGNVTGILNINSNTAAATLVVNTTMRLARTNATSGIATGALNIAGGSVLANTIVAGGGVSSINLTAGGSLTVSNTAGTLAAPIKVLSTSDSTLNLPASNAGSAIVCSNLALGGAGNTINITSVAPISAYPATFNLIAFSSGNAGVFTLGSFPSASPSYVGTIVTNGGTLALKLTAGPVVDLSLHWTGVQGASWDSGTFNFSSQNHATNFFPGAAVLFDDSSAQTTVDLHESLSPGTVTVSNTLAPYIFDSFGNIAGASSLTKKGGNTLILDHTGADTYGSVTISGGTLQLGNNDTNGALLALTIADNGTLVSDSTGDLALSAAISGSGAITQNGSGSLTLSGANSYSGPTALNAGTLVINGSSSGAGAITTAANTVLAGSGSVAGHVTVGGQLNPGPIGGPGVFTASNGLSLSSGASLAFDLSATDPSNPIANDSVAVFGNLAFNNNQIRVNIGGTPQPGASYLLFNYTGTLSGNLNASIAGTHFTTTLDTSTPGAVYLDVTGSSGANLAWNSTSDTTWDALTLNWRNLQNSAVSSFLAGDNALLDDTPGVVTTLNIPAGVSVFPTTVEVNSANNFFTISGAGKISGNASIVKTNTSSLVLATANDFTGTVDVQGGTLQLGADTALGSAAGGTFVESGATLDLNSHNVGGEPITITGAGVAGTGALVNNGGTQFQAIRQLTLAGDASVGGSATWQINNGGGTASLSTGGNAFSITKVGGNQVSFAQLATVDSALADVDIKGGILEWSGLTPNMGDPSRTATVETGGTLSFANGAIQWVKNFVFNGDGSTTTVNVGTGGNPELAGPVELTGNCVFNVGGTGMTISGAINGSGGLIKNGASPLFLNNVDTYSGDTTINTGALRLTGSGSISSPNINIAAGAALGASERDDATLTLTSGQTLEGSGTVNGSLIAGSGSIVSPGFSSVATLTVTNAVTLQGTVNMDLDGANSTNDVITTRASITFGGVLNLVNISGPLTTGSSFKLFKAASYSGSFASVTPATPGAGQAWDTSLLASSGVLSVKAGSAPPTFNGPTFDGNTLTLSGSGGPSSGNYYVLTTTNIGLPLSSWTRLATNSFDSNGHFTFTNGVTGSPQRFFQIELP
ncbi:MAG TPA: autotransporter-associated beta strand repeat-containing protein [Verrucomicrobiae bacterium]|nr:autotransporter-associated beta strand repeat-containing protein [Verrucomicrobiae bacterium]